MQLKYILIASFLLLATSAAISSPTRKQINKRFRQDGDKKKEEPKKEKANAKAKEPKKDQKEKGDTEKSKGGKDKKEPDTGIVILPESEKMIK